MYQCKSPSSCRMRNTKSLKLSFILGVLFAFNLTCSSDFGEPGELGSISIEIIFNNDSSQSSKQSHDWIDPVKDVIKITKAKSISSDITRLIIIIPGVDTVDVNVSPGKTVSETIGGVPVGQQIIKVYLKNIVGEILYTQEQTVKVKPGEISSPSFAAEDFIPQNQFIEIIDPNGGEIWGLGTTKDILWNSSHSNLNVKITLFSGGTISQTIAADEPNNGSYSWDISSELDAGTDYTVRVSSVNDISVYDESDENFTLYDTPPFAWTQTGLKYGTVYDLAINPQGHIFAGVSLKLWRSVDFGSTWQIIGDFDPNGFNQRERIAITKSGRILVTENTKIRISDDNGNTWSYANMETNHSFERVHTIAIAPNGNIYAGRLQDWGCTTCGIFKSTDGGNNFSWVFQAPHEDEVFVRFAFKPDGQIFAGAVSWNDHQMYRSIDDGSSWNYADTFLQGGVDELIITNSGRILVDMSISPSRGFYASDDDGSSWYRIGNNTIERFSGGIVIDENHTIYAFKSLWDCSPCEIGYRSNDDGESWVPISKEGYPLDTDHSPVSSLMTPSQHIFIGTEGSGVLRTTSRVYFGN